ncbi:hypothetical protein F5146DRAFT_1058655 [Armillaria mellea]|nr:hypothetical protein F5146DRAFT_1058655 [Armillaria mellea]
MSAYSPPLTPPLRRVKPLPKRQRTSPSSSPPLAPLPLEYYMPILTNLLEESRIEGGNAKKRKVPHVIGGEVQGRVSRITAAGMQFKESVRVRRKHLEGLVEEGEADVVERALTLGLLGDREGKRRRLSRREVVRAGRSVVKRPPFKDYEGFEFTFNYPSEATTNLRNTKSAVDLLRKRLSAPKKKSIAAANTIKPLPPPPNTKKKKKKRSALANASNPHHLRNYVPSRVPGADQPVNNANSEFVAMRFLTAEIPPRKSKSKSATPTPTALAQQGTNEWICAYCEYELFYGDEEGYRRAIRRRKKILRRRRRARERAAKGVAGKRVEREDNDGDEPVSEEDDFIQPVAVGQRNSVNGTGEGAGETGYG